MLLSEILDHLTYGELSNVSLGGLHTEGIANTDYPRVVAAINLGLLELYKKFPIVRKQLTLQGYVGISKYSLTLPFAESNLASVEPVKYILDADETFVEDILTLNRVRSIDVSGVEEDLPFNRPNDHKSILSVVPSEIKIPFPSDSLKYLVDYTTKPTVIDVSGVVDPTTVEIVLPSEYLEALLAYVGNRFYMSKGDSQSIATATSFNIKYLSACKLLRDYSIPQMDNGSTDTVFELRGWV